MEACFFASNSFVKSSELAPSIKSKNPICPRRPRFSYSVACCNPGSSSFSQDGITPIIKRDWRSFRARLFAAERASSRSEADSSFSTVDLNTAKDYPPQIILENKWAHEIFEPEKGCLLIATEKLDGVHIFERTVILLLSAGKMGPSGIILNRPSLMSIKETRSTAVDAEGTFRGRPLFFGGPLEEGIFLVSTKGSDPNGVGKSGVFEEVMEGLCYGTKERVGCAAEMVKMNMVGIEDIRFFDGYCGWENEQLREEISTGYWALAACSASVIEPASGRGQRLWEEIQGLIAPKKVW